MTVSKSAKYDRQLRIWGSHGQERLERARVCLLGAGPTGAEALKNLVLGGIASFTIVDGAPVQPHDLGNSFFVDHDSLGLPRAKNVSALLQELNDSVAAEFVEEDPQNLVASNPNFFDNFSLVIATQMPESCLMKLDEICSRKKIPLVMARSYGLLGLVRINAQEHCIVESRPDNAVDDLRFHDPWPELQRFADGFDLDVEDAAVHKHIPFGIILIKIACEWKESHGGKLPGNSAERTQFKELISKRQRQLDEDNYKEALASAFKVWAFPKMGSETERILKDSAASVLSSASSDFWILVAALRRFMEESKGEVPLHGAIPDMHSLTEYYVGLQKVYLEKAEKDMHAVGVHAKAILKSVGRDVDSFPPETVKLFCKNVRNLEVIRYKSLAESHGSKFSAEIARYLSSEDSQNAAMYVLLRAADAFAETYNRYPGAFDGEVEEEDVARLKSFAAAIVAEGGGATGGATSLSLGEDLISEVCRFGASELHCIAAVVGGIASQEAIKIITRQFVPLSGTLIYNAIASTSSVFNI